jgi:hypothetical protein
MKNFTFNITVFSFTPETYGFFDQVQVSVQSGKPGGDPGEFENFLLDCFQKWYDAAVVELVQK